MNYSVERGTRFLHPYRGSLIDSTFLAGATPPASTVPPKVDDKIDDNSTDEDKKENDILIDDRPAVGSEYIEEEKDASGITNLEENVFKPWT